MSEPQKFDLVILGSGSTAFAAALRAQESGRSAVMAEERVVGGTVVASLMVRGSAMGAASTRPC